MPGWASRPASFGTAAVRQEARNGQQSVVMMSLEDFKALEETAYLLHAPKNARRLLEAIASLESGQGKERRLAE